MVRTFWRAGMAAAVLIALPSLATAAAQLQKAELRSAADSAQLSLALSGSAVPRVFTLESPDRVVIDLPATRIGPSVRMPAAGGPVRSIRSGVQDRRTLRIVLELDRALVPQLRNRVDAENVCAQGAYEIAGPDGAAQVSIFATGSEVSLAVEAKKLLADKGVAARVVSVPCFELLAEAPEAVRRAVIGDAPVKIGVEAAVRQGWDAIIGSDGIFVGMNSFGASAPYKDLYKHFGVTAAAVADAALSKLGKK
jgi:transketolase